MNYEESLVRLKDRKKWLEDNKSREVPVRERFLDPIIGYFTAHTYYLWDKRGKIVSLRIKDFFYSTFYSKKNALFHPKKENVNLYYWASIITFLP
jgi:hypothetical protein